MRARFVFEKFTEKGDPIKQMGIGYPESQLETMSWKILKFIENKGEEGASLTEIQHYIWVDLEGHAEKDFWKTYPIRQYDNKRGVVHNTFARRTRGHWNTRLLGGAIGSFGHRYYQGLLLTYCKRNPVTKRWTLVRLPNPNEKFFKK